MINTVIETTLKYLENMLEKKRKTVGQFFMSLETAEFMASIFDRPQKAEYIFWPLVRFD